MAAVVARGWKYWTRNKLQILGDYMPAFNRASKRAPDRFYLDLMAGGPVNIDRDTGETFDGSARLAMASEPGFTRLAFCEMNRGNARALDNDLRERHPGDHRFKVYAGDCNELIDQVLSDHAALRRSPTFAFVDQQAAEVRWATLTKLARFKLGQYKVEMWILMSPAMIAREVVKTTGAQFARRVDDLYGCTDWRRIQRARADDRITPDLYRAEMVNLLRWKLRHTLKYAVTDSIPMEMPNGVAIYDMVFATDHYAGDKIMKHLYAQAAARAPHMKEEALAAAVRRADEERGQFGLFADADLPPPVPRARVRGPKCESSEPWDPASRAWWAD